MNIVILYGPIASGKPRRTEMFLKFYKCKHIVEEWDGKTPLKDGDLALTNSKPPFNIKCARVIRLEVAKNQVVRLHGTIT